MRVSFLREPEVVHLGGRSVRIGPWGVCFNGPRKRGETAGRWGGFYVVPPLSFLAVMQLGSILAERRLVKLTEGGLYMLPPSHVRPLCRILVPDAKPRHVALATDAQLVALAIVVTRSNDWKRIHASFTEATAPQEGVDDGAFDEMIYAVGKTFTTWPYEVMHKPWVEVDAVLRAIAKENGHDEVSESMSEYVKDKAAALIEERRQADERLRELGVGGA